jgi:hypothetical protein
MTDAAEKSVARKAFNREIEIGVNRWLSALCE